MGAGQVSDLLNLTSYRPTRPVDIFRTWLSGVADTLSHWVPLPSSLVDNLNPHMLSD